MSLSITSTNFADASISGNDTAQIVTGSADFYNDVYITSYPQSQLTIKATANINYVAIGNEVSWQVFLKILGIYPLYKFWSHNGKMPVRWNLQPSDLYVRLNYLDNFLDVINAELDFAVLEIL